MKTFTKAVKVGHCIRMLKCLSKSKSELCLLPHNAAVFNFHFKEKM